MSNFYEDYYDIESIKAEQELVPARFLVDSDGLGALHPNGSSNEKILEGAVLNLPFWLAKALHLKNVAMVETPKILSAVARSHLKADPRVLNLQISGDFYQIGCKFAELVNDPELVPSADSLLLRVFAQRHPEILNKSQSWINEDFSQFASKLTAVELQLFLIGREASIDFANWKRTQGLFTPSTPSTFIPSSKRARFQ